MIAPAPRNASVPAFIVFTGVDAGLVPAALSVAVLGFDDAGGEDEEEEEGEEFLEGVHFDDG